VTRDEVADEPERRIRQRRCARCTLKFGARVHVGQQGEKAKGTLPRRYARVTLGVGHPQIHEEGDRGAAADIPIKPCLVPRSLRLQRYVLRRTAEYRDSHRVGKSNAQSTNLSRKKLRLHHGVYGRISAYDNQSYHDEDKRLPESRRRTQRTHQW